MEDEKDLELQDQEQYVDNGENTENTEENKDDPQYRGKILMQRALEQLEQGNMEEFEIDRKMANEYFDKMNSEEEELDALYNESRNFGIIYHVIEENAPKLMETKQGQKSLRNIIKTIKGNEILQEQFNVYNNLIPSKHINNVDEYINEAISMIPSFDKKLVKENNDKLIKLIKSEKLDEMILIDNDKLNLYESIEYVAINRKNLQNIDEYVNATNVIKEAIAKIPSVKENKMTIDEYTNEANNISENMNKGLNVSEIKLLNEIASGNGEKYFNECKDKTLSKLDEMMLAETDMQTKSRLSQIFEKINNKQYTKENAVVDIAEMIELQETIDE